MSVRGMSPLDSRSLDFDSYAAYRTPPGHPHTQRAHPVSSWLRRPPPAHRLRKPDSTPAALHSALTAPSLIKVTEYWMKNSAHWKGQAMIPKGNGSATRASKPDASCQ